MYIPYRPTCRGSGGDDEAGKVPNHPVKINIIELAIKSGARLS